VREELPAIAGRAVEAALGAGAGEAESWVERSREREVRVHDGAAESVTEATGRGVGIRAWIGGRVGYAYGTDLSGSGLSELGAAAAEAARAADEDEHATPPQPAGAAEPVEGLRDPAIAEFATPEAVELARRVERVALEHHESVAAVEEVVYVDADAEAAISSSRGRSGFYAASQCYSYLQAMAGEGADRQTGLGFGVARAPQRLDPEEIGAEAGEEASSMVGARKPESRACPVVLSERVAASVLGFVGGSLCADEVQRGRSPFAERLGEELASEAIELADDGTDPGGLATAPFDGEGTPHGRTPLLGGGRLRAYLYDTYTAERGSERSTGNASRGSYRSPPGVGPSNLVLGAGEVSLEGLLAEAGDGVYVTDVAGLHSGVNPVTGRFSVGAAGRSIRGGELAEPLREFTLAGDLLSTLAGVRAVGSERRWVPFGGSVLAAPILVAELSVGGT
jgi:PmbA protein